MNNRRTTSTRDRTVAALRELVEALDRRVPHVERLGEVRIAREAAVLRQEAAARIAQLTAAQAGDDERDAASADATMADDGGPLREP